MLSEILARVHPKPKTATGSCCNNILLAAKWISWRYAWHHLKRAQKNEMRPADAGNYQTIKRSFFIVFIIIKKKNHLIVWHAPLQWNDSPSIYLLHPLPLASSPTGARFP
jgi:hypothetical protein